MFYQLKLIRVNTVRSNVHLTSCYVIRLRYCCIISYVLCSEVDKSKHRELQLRFWALPLRHSKLKFAWRKSKYSIYNKIPGRESLSTEVLINTMKVHIQHYSNDLRRGCWYVFIVTSVGAPLLSRCYFSRQGVKACVVLCPLLGVTWIFGLMAVKDGRLAFTYIFTILNSLQVRILRELR